MVDYSNRQDSCAQVAIPNAALMPVPTPKPPERDHTVLCEPTTGNRVILITTYDPNTGVPATTGYNLDGSTWAGSILDLVVCDTPDNESDPVEMCDGSTTFIRWVVKKDGVPTGAVFDTTLAGAAYVPVGPVTVGACESTVQWKEHFQSIVGAATTLTAISAALGAVEVKSYTVKQILGQGAITGDSGNAIIMSAGESWGSSIENLKDGPLSQAVTLNPGTGEMRVLVLYR